MLIEMATIASAAVAAASLPSIPQALISQCISSLDILTTIMQVFSVFQGGEVKFQV